MKNTLFIGKKIIGLNSVDSTSNYLSNLLKTTNVMDGTIVWTQKQIKGKGQRGNNWISEDFKNLTLSLFLKLNFISVDTVFLISILVSNSLHKLVSIYCENTKIKWPNDIYVSNQKIGGILIENSIHKSSLKNTIIGIGFNVNQINFPSELQATSLKTETNKKFDIDLIANELFSLLEKNYFLLKNGEINQLKKYYFDNLLGFQEEREFIIVSENKKITGVITDVKDNGFLEVLSQNKKLLFEIKEIAFVF